jgi:hypothetical protein
MVTIWNLLHQILFISRILAEYARNLKALEARECRDITENSLYRLRQRGVKIDVRPPQPPRSLAGLRQRRMLNVQI